MKTVKQLPLRSEIPSDLTWDLTLIFPSDADFEAAFKQAELTSHKIKQIAGTLGQSASSLKAGIDQVLALYRQVDKLSAYASMKNDQDTTNSHYQAYQAQVETLTAAVNAATAFLEPEILAIAPQRLNQLEQDPLLRDYQHFLDMITINRQHILDQERESLLAAAGDVLDNSSNIFNILDNSDLKFPNVTDENGQEYQLSAGIYDTLLESPDVTVRYQAFTNFYQVYGQFKNTFAATLAGEVKKNNYLAQVHHYDSAKDQALAENYIVPQVYDTLITEVNQHLDLLQQYVALRRQVLNLPQLHMYDLYVPLITKSDCDYTFNTAKEIVQNALAVFGTDYLSHVKEIFTGRYIDVMENQGKVSGAYSGGCYDSAPYELLNWQNNLDNVYTLAHETGHSVHSWYTRHYQPYMYGDYPIFLAEIASTTNENILTEYLLQTQTDPKVRAYVLNYYLDSFKGTVYRQTQFAQFEHYIHQAAAQGQALTADFMSDYYGKLNAHYYGPAVINDPQIAWEWTRIPHFYMDYYVYQYATGFAAASYLAKQIVTQQPQAITKYLNYLKAGNSNYPLNIMQEAGIDMTKGDYLKTAFATFAQRLNELKTLLKQ